MLLKTYFGEHKQNWAVYSCPEILSILNKHKNKKWIICVFFKEKKPERLETQEEFSFWDKLMVY